MLVALATVGLCLLSLSLVAVGSGGATPLDGNDTNVTDSNVTDTVSDTTDTVTDTVADTTDTVSDTTDTVTDTVADTTDTVTNTTDTVTDTVADTTDTTTTDTIADTTDTTTDTLSDTTDTTTDTLSDTTDSLMDTVSNTTEQTGEAVTNTTSSDSLLTVESDDTLLSSDSTSSSDGDTTSGDTDDGRLDSTDSDGVSTLSEELADVTGALTGGVTETTTTAVTGVAETADTVVGDDGLLTSVGDSLVTGSSLPTTDDGTLAGLEQSTPAGTPPAADETSGSTPAPRTEPPRPDSEAAAAVESEPTATPAGSGGPVGTLAAMASRPFSEPVPVSGQTAAGAGLAVGAAAAAGTVLLRGSSFTGTGAGRNALRVARHTAPQTVRAAGASVLDRLLRIATFFRYSRYDDSDPLENEARAAVMSAVEADPGRPITEVAEAADVNLSTARYHVRVLRKEDMLMRAEVRGRKRLFPAFTQDPELLAALSDEATAPLVDALQRLEPATVGALADELEKSPSTVTHHLQRLEEDGVVVRERDGRSVKNSLAPTTREALAPSAEAETEPTPAAQSAD